MEQQRIEERQQRIEENQRAHQQTAALIECMQNMNNLNNTNNNLSFVDRSRNSSAVNQLDSLESRIIKSSNLLKNLLFRMPTSQNEITDYLDYVERLFSTYEIPEDCRCATLAPFLTEKARAISLQLNE